MKTGSLPSTFLTNKSNNIVIRINDTEIPLDDTAKYLWMTLDGRLDWKVKKKRKEIKMK